MTIRERYHVEMAELCGVLAGWLLKRLAIHALWIDDVLTFERVKSVLQHGVDVGWDDKDPTSGVKPNRSA